MNEINIVKLRFPENIRKRFDMYIGSSINPNHIIQELIDNSIDETLSKYADNVSIITRDTYSIIKDNGRGLPVYIDKDSPNNLIIKAIFTESHVGSKFDILTDKKVEYYSRGKNGIGVKATNALSNKFFVIVNLKKKNLITSLPWIIKEAAKNKNPVYILEYNKGIFIKEIVCSEKDISSEVNTLEVDKVLDNNWSTIIISYPDNTIFTSVKSDIDVESLQYVPLVGQNVSIILNGRNINKFSFKNLFDKTVFYNNEILDIKFNFESTEWIIYFGYSDNDISEYHKGSVNTLITDEGIHLNSFFKALRIAFKIEYSIEFTISDIKLGLRSFVMVLCHEPQFTSQTKEKLVNIPNFNEKDFINNFSLILSKIIRKNKEYFDIIYNRIFEYKKDIDNLVLKDLVQAVIIKGDSKISRGLGSDVWDCSTRDRSKAELFIVEGKSAAGTLRRCRDKIYHAVLPLRGKPLNSSVVDLKTVINNKEMKSLINVIGAGVDPFMEIDKIRYGKIICVSDADPDGLSINALLLGTIGSFLRPLIDAGKIFISDVPLYKQDKTFIWKKEDLIPNKSFKRFKGLGEMNPDELYLTAVNSSTRKLIQVTSNDIDKAFDLLKTSIAKRNLMIKHGILE